MRRPDDLKELLASPGDVSDVLQSVDPERAAAVHAVFAELIAARWWQPRFPATAAALRYFLGEGYASWFVGREAMLRAEGEDLLGTALADGVLALVAGAAHPGEELPPWLLELFTYEYLLAIGLPRRAAEEALDEDLEGRLLANTSWVSGGRLSKRVLVAPFVWPVGALQEEPHDAEPDGHLRLFWLEGASASEVEAPHLAGDVLDLLAAGADDATIQAVDPDAEAALNWFHELGLLA